MNYIASSTKYTCSSISIACWVVVFSPQIFENFRRSSADGLSVIFVIVWLLGDVFNVIGAVLQGVIPTMTILAVYYTLADIVLLGQCFYYRGFTLSDAPLKSSQSRVNDEEATEESTLLSTENDARPHVRPTPADADRLVRSDSASSSGSHRINVDATHLSPATPLLSTPGSTPPPAINNLKPAFALSALVFNISALLLVCLAGAFGWWLSTRTPSASYHRPSHHPHHQNPSNSYIVSSEETDIHFDIWGQISGYLCAFLYLASRIPQLLLNARRKSTEGVSMLFFLFACVGNLTYVLSIMAFEPRCARLERGGAMSPAPMLVGSEGYCRDGEWRRDYGRYILMNASWLAGSAGTLLLDLGIFAQFWLYRGREGVRA